MEIFPDYSIGEKIYPTTDIKTDAGYIHLIHENKEILEEDTKFIIEHLMPNMFIVKFHRFKQMIKVLSKLYTTLKKSIIKA